MIALSTFVIAVLVLYIYSTLSTMKHLKLKSFTDRLTFEKEAQQRYYETQLHNQEELRRMKHDMNGHLNTISRLLSENNKEEALCYLSQLGDYYERHQKAMYSHDPYLNAVVTNYVTVFAENNTPFEQDIQIGKMYIHHVEICLILNNALQNALDASLKLPPKKRYVRLQIKTKQSRLLFRITNRFNEELKIDSGFPRSTKVGESHGYGLTSIRNAAESVGGFADYIIEGDMFVLDVAM
jgi:sensor histidine kinase regulating citrate/malate metabolism